MKKVLVLVFVFTLMFSLTAYAAEGDKPVSSDEDYVGKGVVLEEGQMGITSVGEPAAEEDYVGKDVVLEEGQMGITSVEASSSSSDRNIPLISALVIGIAVLFAAISYRKLRTVEA